MENSFRTIARNIGFVRKSIMLAKFLLNAKYYLNQESYFPETRTKGKFRIFLDHVLFILKNGDIDKFYFAQGFDGKSKTEMDKYVPYRKFMIEAYKRNFKKPYNNVCILRDKRLFEAFGRAFGLPVVPSAGIMKNGEVSIGEDSIPFREFIISHPKLFLKADGGECGEGVFSVISMGGGKLLVNNEMCDTSTFLGMLKGTYLVQPLLVQHDEMNRMYSGSVNTLRIVTITDKHSGKPKILASLLRIGTNGNTVDNWAKGGLAVDVNNDGTLHQYGFYKPGFGTKTANHPNSNIEFAKFTVPFFNEAIELCKKFHKQVGVHSIGWDVAITNDGPVFIEGNDNWEISLMQIPCGPLKEKVKEIF